MDGFSIDLVVLAAFLLANRTIVPELRRAPLFWGFQAINLGGAAYFAIWGVTGLERYPVASWLVAGLLVFHSIQNVIIFQTRRPKL